MTLTLLLDLDDTLLGNNIQTFLPAYLKLLGKHLIGYVTPELMIQNLLASTQDMLKNNSARLSLERAFDQSFYPAIQHPKDEMRPILEQFYEEIFPGLEQLTSRRPAAIRMVEDAVQHGHTLVVATNPIFPRKAILHRLVWAGLPPETVPFTLITDYERFHFAKPNPAFFAEILAQLGWPDQPAVVIGNSLEEDLMPGASLGLPVFWIVEEARPLPEGLNPLRACGSLDQVPAWLRHVDAANLRQEFLTPQALLAVLKSTPAALDTFSRSISQKQWQEQPEPGEWSLTEIICHLRDVDREINIPRIEKLLAEDNPFLSGINSDTWADERDYLHQDGKQALEAFILVRAQLIERLESLTEAGWLAPARHAIFGPTTLKELISFVTIHDRTHIQQSMNTIKTLAEAS